MTCDRLERDGLLGRLGEEMSSHVEQCSDCRTRRDQYARLAAALAQESVRPLPGGWKERTLERLRAEQASRRRRSVVLSGFVASAAAVALFLFWPRGDVSARAATYAMKVEEGRGGWRGPGPAHPGDQLHFTVTRGADEHFELRVYRAARALLVRCPGDPAPACQVRDGVAEVRLPIPSFGDYQVDLLESRSPLPPPAGDRDADIRAARGAGARLTRTESINVN